MADFPNYFLYTQPPEVSSNTPVHYSESMSLKTFTRRVPAQRWEFDIDGLVKRENAGKFDGFMMSKEGRLKTFTYSLPPEHENIVSPIATTTTTVDARSKGDKEIDLYGQPFVVDGAGGFLIRFVGQAKVYMATVSQKIDVGITIDLITITPPLLEDVPAGTTVEFQPNITVRFANDNMSGTAFRQSVFKRYNLKLIEAL